MPTMKAAVTTGDGSVQLQDVDIPVPQPNQILVKVVTAAQNPTDWKTAGRAPAGNISGCDFAGTVVEIGADVPTGLRKIGERVAGFVHGGIALNGAFSEYLVSDAAIVIALPDDVSFENAAQLGVAIFTVSQALYQTLALPTPLQPTSTPSDILIWSGTSAMGQYAVQFAKLAGLRVISTASAKNIDFVKSLGADEVFDYNDSEAYKKILDATGGTLKYALDCISEGTTPIQVTKSFGSSGGTVVTLLPYKEGTTREDVKITRVLAYTVLGKAIDSWGLPAYPEHYENGKGYVKLVSEILSKGLIKFTPVRLYPHGVASVAQGFEDMKNGKVHAEKITYRISDTPGLSK